MIITRTKLIDAIFNRIHKAVSKVIINDVISIIEYELAQALIENQAISIENFGTFSPYQHPSHHGIDISSGKEMQTQSVKTVKFRTNCHFQNLINNKKNFFQKSKKRS